MERWTDVCKNVEPFLGEIKPSKSSKAIGGSREGEVKVRSLKEKLLGEEEGEARSSLVGEKEEVGEREKVIGVASGRRRALSSSNDSCL